MRVTIGSDTGLTVRPRFRSYIYQRSLKHANVSATAEANTGLFRVSQITNLECGLDDTDTGDAELTDR